MLKNYKQIYLKFQKISKNIKKYQKIIRLSICYHKWSYFFRFINEFFLKFIKKCAQKFVTKMVRIL